MALVSTWGDLTMQCEMQRCGTSCTKDVSGMAASHGYIHRCRSTIHHTDTDANRFNLLTSSSWMVLTKLCLCLFVEYINCFPCESYSILFFIHHEEFLFSKEKLLDKWSVNKKKWIA